MDWARMDEKFVQNFVGNLKGGGHFWCLDVCGRIRLKWILKNTYGVRIWIGFIWLRIVSSGWFLWTR